MSLQTIKRMHSFLSRHAVDKQGKGWSPDQDGYPSAGRVSWAAWGGDAAKSWVAGILARVEKAAQPFEDELLLAEMWKDGEVEWADLPDSVRDAIDSVFSDQPQEASTAEVSETPVTELLHKADDEHRFTLGPWYIPNRYDAHGEWTDADELQKALWDYVRTGDRDIRLQHNRDIVAGEWLEALSFPVPVTIGMNKGVDAKQVTYPAGTVFLGVQWRPWAWELVKAGKITGFSIGGAAARIDMAMPEDMAKGKTGAEVRWDMVARARVREHVEKQQPTSSEVHVPTIMGGKRKKRRKPIRKGAGGGLSQWFDEKWVDISRPKEGGGFEPCGREDADSGKYPKCVPASVAAKMSERERKSAIRRKRQAESSQDREGKKPIMVATFKARNVPTNPALYARVKAEARKKFDVYPSAYANGWLVQEYKKRGGKYKVVKASFGGDRSEAGRYAANVRWQRQASGGKGPIGLPRTRAGKAVMETMRNGSHTSSLVGHLDFDALARDMKQTGIGPDDKEYADLVYRHLTEERRRMWIQSVHQALDGVPRNPNGSRVFVKGGGGASGKSTSGKMPTPVDVPAAKGNKDGQPPAAVMVNSDDWKMQTPEFRALHDTAMRQADAESAKKGYQPNSEEWHATRRSYMLKAKAASFVHEESSLIAKMTLYTAIHESKDVIYDGTMDNGAEKRMAEIRLIRDMGAKEVHGLFFSCDTETAVARAKNRENDTTSDSYGRVVHEPALRTAHRSVSANLPKYVESGLFDTVVLFDTNQRPSKRIAAQEQGGKWTVEDPIAYERFLDKAKETV